VRAPDYVDPTVAWRSWLVVAEGEEIRLSSVVFRNSWPPRCELKATCQRKVVAFPRIWRRTPTGHAAPTERCRCGIYGAREAEQAATYVDQLWNEEPLRPPLLHRAIGRVSLWGTVVECEDGWRASHAYPERIYLPRHGRRDEAIVEPGELAVSLSRYGVPVELIDCDLCDGEALVSALRRLAPSVAGRGPERPAFRPFHSS
jgi:hypothetical protein